MRFESGLGRTLMGREKSGRTLMNSIFLIIVGIGLLAAVASIGPRLAAFGILALVGVGTRHVHEQQAQALTARSEQPADGWGPSSKTDQKLLDGSVKLAVTRTSLSSKYPSHSF